MKKSARNSENGDGEIEISQRMRFPNPLPEPFENKEIERKDDEKETPKIDKKPPNSSPMRTSPLRWPVRESIDRGSNINT